MGGTILFLAFAVVWLAYANGANDNFKGVATLYGSETTGYQGAIAWATITTFSGSLAAIFLGSELVRTFSGQGLVPVSLVGDPLYLLAVGLGAAATVLFATRIGIPVSTTHALTGALVGAGFLMARGGIYWGGLGERFVLPLLASPFLALVLSAALSRLAFEPRSIRGDEGDGCLCVGEERPKALVALPVGEMADLAAAPSLPATAVGTHEECSLRFGDRTLRIDIAALIDRLHFLSAGAVGFARGLNDTPKIVALLVAARLLEIPSGFALVGVAMALGGVLSARRVAVTMSRRITRMDHRHGFAANAVTSFLVIFASRWGMPVSTTHVSCGSLFGIGLANGGARWKTIAGIFLAWVTTLPLAALLSGAVVAIGRSLP